MLTALAVLAGALVAQTTPTTLLPWSVNPNHTLIWDGRPYLPVGLRIEGQPELVREALQQGVRDFVVDLPAQGDWSPVLRELEQAEARYFVSISSLAPSAESFAVEPEGYRIGPIYSRLETTLRIPGAKEALVLVASQRDGTVRWSRRMPVAPDGSLQVVVDEGSSAHVLLVYPRVTDSRLIDCWEGFDRRRDEVIARFRSLEARNGLRGIINPAGVVNEFPGPRTQAVPTSEFFRMEFADHLRRKYGSMATLQRAWAIGTNTLTTFEDMARLVPLWAGTRGVSYLWDPVEDKLYRADNQRSTIWTDLRDAIHAACRRRFARLSDSLRAMFSVPVVVDWSGWNGVYGDGPLPDGIGFAATATSASALAGDAAPGVSTALERAEPAWSVGTDIRPGDLPIEEAVRHLEGMGVRGWFFRVTRPEDRAELVRLASVYANDLSAAEWSPAVLPYPVAATNPAVPTRLVGGVWWLPSPELGERIDFGAHMFGYRIGVGARTRTALWLAGNPTRVRLRLLNPRQATFQSFDGSDPQPRIHRNSVEVTLGPVPLMVGGVDEVPIPEPAMLEITDLVDRTLRTHGSLVDPAGNERYFFLDNKRAFDRNPGGSFATLRGQLSRLAMRVAPYHWLEGEASRDHTFSAVVADLGASAGLVLSLSTRVASPDGSRFARYELGNRGPGEFEVWIAGRLDRVARESLVVQIGEMTLRNPQPAVGPYAEGFAWYRFGSVELPDAPMQLSLVVDDSRSMDLKVDVVVLARPGFRPSSPTPPIDFVREFVPPAEPRGGPAQRPPDLRL